MHLQVLPWHGPCVVEIRYLSPGARGWSKPAFVSADAQPTLNVPRERSLNSETMNTTRSPEPVRLLVFSPSLRSDSLKRHLGRVQQSPSKSNVGEVDGGAISGFDASSENGDPQDGGGFPGGAEELRRRLQGWGGSIISAPE